MLKRLRSAHPMLYCLALRCCFWDAVRGIAAVASAHLFVVRTLMPSMIIC